MSRFLFFVFAWAVLIHHGVLAVSPSENSVTAIAAAAHEAYDRGDHETAAGHFHAWLEKSPGSFEAWYNAGNNSFRAGRAGEAVLFYRRAWYLNPRDADVQANLLLAQQRLGALAPSPGLIDHAAQELSHREWTGLFKSAYWSGLVVAVVMLFVAPSRRWLKPVLALLVIATLAGFAGWRYWQEWQESGEAVIVSGRQTARYEPRESSTAFFNVPEGSVVRIEESFDQWVKIAAGDQSGWVPANAAKTVNAWKNGEFD